MNLMTALGILVSLALSGVVFYQNMQLTGDLNELEVKINQLHERAFTTPVSAAPREVIDIHGSGEPVRVFMPATYFCSAQDPEDPEDRTTIEIDDNGGVLIWGLADGRPDILGPADASGTYAISGLYLFLNVTTGDGAAIRRRAQIDYYSEKGEITDFSVGELSFSPRNCQ